MRQPQLFTSWLITCHSPQECRSVQSWLASHINPDRILTDTSRTMPGGVEQVQTAAYRLGDSFAAIRILPASATNPSAFRLVFQRLPSAKRFWKDLMVSILQEIEAIPETASITLDYKGNQAPPVASGPS